MFSNVCEMIDEINESVSQFIRENMEPCKARDLGLDSRSGYALFVNEDCIAVEGDGHLLDYYGGFEYVDKEYVRVIGDWKFYFAEDQRVQEHICIYFAEQETADEEEEA